MVQNIPEPVSVRLFGSVTVTAFATANIQVNGNLVWEDYEVVNRTVPVDLDVTGFITPGDNTFTIGISNLNEGVFTLSAEVSYTGAEPGPPTPPPTPFNWYLVAGLLGGVAIITVIGVIAYEEEQKRQQMMMLALMR